MDFANLEKLKVVDLRNELQTRGLDTKGVKAVLIERLRAHLEGTVPPSPGTPGRRSRRTRSMTKSPSPSPVKKAREVILETLEEESYTANTQVEEQANEEKFSTPEKLQSKCVQETTPVHEQSEDQNINCIEESFESAEEVYEDGNLEDGNLEDGNLEDGNLEDGNLEDGNLEDGNLEDGNLEDRNLEENINQDEEVDSGPEAETEEAIPETLEPEEEEKPQENYNLNDEASNHNDEKSEKHAEDEREEVFPKQTLRERSRSHSMERRKSRNHLNSASRSRSHSRSHSRSRSRVHKSKSDSRSRSRSPKRRSGACSLESPSKTGEDTSTPEDEPTIEENQFGLSWFDSDLHLRIDPVTFTSAKPMSHDIYALVWSGARTNYGVREGKVCFEVRLSEETNLNRDHPFRDEPHTKGFRVGFSMPSCSLLLGESENSFAYCDSGRKVSNSQFVEFAKPYQLDDVIGCYLDLESTPCTIKYTLNGEDIGVAFEFDKAILGEDQALFPHVLTKGYEYEINLADNDNLLVNVERKVRKRRKPKLVEEEKQDRENTDQDKQVEDSKKDDKTEDDQNEKQLDDINKEPEQKEVEAEKKGNTEEANQDVEMSDEPQEKTDDLEPAEKDETEQENSKIPEDQEKTEHSVDSNEKDDTHSEKKDDDKKFSGKDIADKEGPSASKRQKVELPQEEDEYEEIHPEPRDHMSLVEGYELIALIPEEKYIPGPQRPESRKDCEVILMVGLPGAGKTTWVLNHIKENPDKRYHVVGADSLIAKMTIDGAPRKSVHRGRFDRIYELCFNVLTSLEDIAVKRRRNFILDQANAYASAQRRKMKGFADFKRIAVVCIPNEEELKRRLADKKEKGHAYTLKESTLNTLQAAFTLPSLEFGWFDDIIFTDLGIDEAKEEVKKYNEKGKKALDENHANRDKRQRRDNYRSDNRHRQDDRRRYDNRNDNRWNDRRAGGGGGGYNHGGGGANRWGGGGGGGYRNNSGGYRDDRGYGSGGGGGRGYDNRHQRNNNGPQNWMQNNRNRYDDRSNRYGSGGGGSGRYDSYGGGGGSRDYRSGGGDHRDYRDRNRTGSGGGGSGSNRRDSHRSGGSSSNQRDFRPGHRDTREDSRGGSSATSATTTSSKYNKPSSVASGNNGGYDKQNKNQSQANNWTHYQQQQAGSVGQQQQYWNYDAQGYGNQQQWQSMDPQQQQQWMAWWQQQGSAQHAVGGATSDPNQYWSQYSYSTSNDATKK